MQILLANPRGFCAGVDRAVAIVQRALSYFGAPIYVRHAIVHNRYVVEQLCQQGACFVEELDAVPVGATVIFSAHGVAPSVRQAAVERKLTVLDATCPLVAKVHMEVARASRRGVEVILIGHAGHPEITGTLGQYNNPSGGIYLVESVQQAHHVVVKNSENICFATQTTLSVQETAEIVAVLSQRYPRLTGPRKEDICYATTNRQQAVRNLAEQVELVLVVGSPDSSNSHRLVEVVQRMGKPVYLVDQEEMVQPAWLANVDRVGVTAGASAPEVVVQAVVNRLCLLGGSSVVELPGDKEGMEFALPKQLQRSIQAIPLHVY